MHALRLDRFERLLGLTGPLLQCLLDAAVDLGLEQRLQDVFAPSRVGFEQLAELALGEHDDPGELVALEAEQPLDLRRHPAGLGGKHLAFFLRRGARAPPQRRLRLLRGGAGAARLRTLLLRASRHPVALRAKAEVEDDLGERAGLRVVAAQALRVALAAGCLAVEREADGVEDGRLPGAGRAVDEKARGRAEHGEIEILLAGVGPERAHREAQRLHAGTSRSRSATAAATYTKTSFSSSVGGWPVISLEELP